VSSVYEAFFPHITVWLAVLVRVFCFFLCMPGLGEFLPPKIRLLFSLGISFFMAQVLGITEPPDLSVQIVVHECIVGVFFGYVVRAVFECAAAVGHLINHQIALSFAHTSIFPQASLDMLTAFLKVYLLMLMFATNLHLTLVAGLMETYRTIPFAGTLLFSDYASTLVEAFARGFRLSIQIGMPFLILHALYYLVLGVVSRLVPMLPVFFIGHPLISIFVFLMLLALVERFSTVFLYGFNDIMLMRAGEWLW
jgi:flagellar biosynthetic protein FliR